MRVLGLLRERPVLSGILIAHAVLSMAIWLSGSATGTFALRGSIGVIGYDAAHGLNPAVPLLDYFDTFTGGFLTQGLLTAPLTWFLPITWAVAIVGLLTNSAVLVVAWTFLERNVGRIAAGVGTIAFLLGPPTMRHHALVGPNYHYNELFFDLGMAALWAEIVLHDRRSWRWTALLGLTCGYAITNCWGSIGYLAIVMALWWVADPGLLGRKATWAFLPAAVLGLGPLLAKLFVHSSYHQGVRGLRDLAFTHSGEGAMDSVSMGPKLLDFLGGDYAGAIGYLDTLGPWLGARSTLIWAQASSALLFAITAAVLVVGWRAIPAGLRGLLPGASNGPTPEGKRALAAYVPSLFAIVLILGYLTSELTIQPADPAFSQFREDRFLPPLSAFLALNVGVLAQLLHDRIPKKLWAESLAVIAIAFGVPSALAQVAMVDGEGLVQTPGMAYRGAAWSIETLYAADVLAGDPQRGQQFCAGFPEQGQGDCYRGFAWTVGIGYLMESDDDPESEQIHLPQGVGDRCRQLGDPWDRECMRQLGWHMWSESIARLDEPHRRVEHLQDRCRVVSDGDPEREGWCLEGLGFYFADHYAWAPHKLQFVFPPEAFPPEARRSIVRGIGYTLAYIYEHERVAQRLCGPYAELEDRGDEACREGVDLGMQAFERPLPGNAQPGPLPKLPKADHEP